MNNEKTETASAVGHELQVRRRPKTRGELLDCLKQNIDCEVVTSNVEITNILLDGYLEFAGKYKTYPSENYGWTIYASA